MTQNSLPYRRSIRLPGFDYSQPGSYFITICTKHMRHLFGSIRNGELRLNAAGIMVTAWYYELESKFPDVLCDEFVCMPNHVHFVVNTGTTHRKHAGNHKAHETPTVGADLCVCPNKQPPNPKTHQPANMLSPGHQEGSLHIRYVVQWFKAMTTNDYILGVKHLGWAPFPGKLWHRNYWERIVRGPADLDRIRQYIHNNPKKPSYRCMYALKRTTTKPTKRPP